MNDFKEKIKKVEKLVKNDLATENRRAKYISEKIEICKKETLPVIEKLNDAISEYDLIFIEYKELQVELENVRFDLHKKSTNEYQMQGFICYLGAKYFDSNLNIYYNYKKSNGNYILKERHALDFNEVADAFIAIVMPNIIEKKLTSD